MPAKLRGPRGCSQMLLSRRGAGQTGFISSKARTGESTNLSLEVYRKQDWLIQRMTFLLSFFIITRGFGYTLGFMKYKPCLNL